MFNLFKAAEKVGSELIEEAVGQFESIAQRIEAGVQHNRDQIDENDATIQELQAATVSLSKDASRGESVATKLRELVA